MFKLVLTVDGQERRALYVSYQYFRTLIPDDKLYRKFLQKNFPYEREDLFDLEPYEWCLPTIKATQLDIALMEKARINIALRKRTPIPNPQKQKEDYYTELTRLRYDARLDRGIIPNLRGLYHMEARPMERTTSTFNHHHLVGGVFTVTLEATPEDSLYYGWLISETSKTGEIIVYKNDEYTPEFRIKFADCYCTSIKGNLNGRTGMPMTITLELSPAIVENRGILVEKPWKEGALAASAPIEEAAVVEEEPAEETAKSTGTNKEIDAKVAPLPPAPEGMKFTGTRPDKPQFAVVDENNNITKYGKWYYRRPAFLEETIKTVWDEAEKLSENKQVIDPLSAIKHANGEGELIVLEWDGKKKGRGSKWHMGHKPGWEFSKHQLDAARRGIGIEEFRKEYNNPEHLYPEHPKSNLSHEGESSDKDYYAELTKQRLEASSTRKEEMVKNIFI